MQTAGACRPNGNGPSPACVQHPTGRARGTEQGALPPPRAADPGHSGDPPKSRGIYVTGSLQHGLGPGKGSSKDPVTAGLLPGSCRGPWRMLRVKGTLSSISPDTWLGGWRAAGSSGNRVRPTSRLRGVDDGQQEQEDSRPQGCSCRTRHLREKCPACSPRLVLSPKRNCCLLGCEGRREGERAGRRA